MPLKFFRVLIENCELTPPLDLLLSALAIPAVIHFGIFLSPYIAPVLIFLGWVFSGFYGGFLFYNWVRLWNSKGRG
jgi:hypothetical protein